MKSKLIVFSFLFISYFGISQSDTLFVTHEYTNQHMDATDSLNRLKELYITFHNVDTSEFVEYYVEMIEKNSNRIIVKKKLPISQSTPLLEVVHDKVTVLIGMYPPDNDYTLLSKLINYEGVETSLFTNNVSLDD